LATIAIENARLFSTAEKELAERRDAENALAEAARDWKVTFDAVKDAMWLLDDDMRIRSANKATMDIFSLDPDQILGRHCWEVVHGTGVPAADCPVMRTRKSLRRETSKVQKGDRWLEITADPVLDERGRPVGTVHVVCDITDRVRAEETLRKSESYYRTVFENSLFGIAVSGVDFKFATVNDAFCRLIEYDASDLIGKKSIGDVTFADDMTASIEMTKKVMRREIDRFMVEKRYVTKSGKIIHALTFVRGMYDEDGRYTGGMAAIMDVTARKAAEDAILRLNLELERRVAERTSELEAANEDLEAFAYSVSHDLRAPLRHIDGFMKLLEKRIGENLDEKSRHYMENVSSSAVRMGELIDNLLSFSRMGRSDILKTRVDLAELVAGVIKELAPEMKDRSIHWNVAKLPSVMADKAMLRIAAVNLISNAVKFSRPRKVAEIEIGSVPGSRDEDVFFVRDNGIGFEMKHASRLFGVFQRLHDGEEFEGTGIGLANVHRVITRQGGRVWGEGKLGEGATFFFSLPRPADADRTQPVQVAAITS